MGVTTYRQRLVRAVHALRTGPAERTEALEAEPLAWPIGHRPSGGWDAAAWTLVSLIVLSIVPIGWVSGDAIAHSASFARGSWFWNPNHLLMEPIGAWWQATLTELGVHRSGPDQLKLLSILAGAVAAGLFRWKVAGPLAPGRLEANHATAWLAFSSGFSRLWISGENHMLQMPFLVLAAMATVHYVRRPDWPRAIAAGATVALSALLFISNVLLIATVGAAIGLWRLTHAGARAGMKAAAGAGAGGLVTIALASILAWSLVAPPDTGLLEWLTSYGGGQVSGRAASGYGVELSLAGVMISGARTLYGAASSLVDLAPVVEVARDGHRPSAGTVINFLAFCAGAAFMSLALIRLLRSGGPVRAPVLLLMTGWLVAVVVFGVYWNNSDDQFFFQLAVPIGALASSVRLRRGGATLALAGLSALALTWNAADLARNRIMYPRQERVELLESMLSGAGFVIYPGQDEVHNLLYFTPAGTGGDRMSLMSLRSQYDAAEGLAVLRDTIADYLTRGERVDVVSVFDVPPRQHPWKALDRAGYGPAAVRGLLDDFPLETATRRIGPFTVRSIIPAR